MGRFQRPLGAQADLKEIEYVSALHQSQSGEVRQDGSVKDVDIVHFLKSRHGLEVSAEDVRRTILSDLGGGDDEDDCIDLAELVAILLIPTLIKAAGPVASARDRRSTEEHESGADAFRDFCDRAELKLTRALAPAPGLIDDVLAMILRDVTGSDSPKRLTASLLREVLRAYGEDDLAADEAMIEEMLAVAAGGPGAMGGADDDAIMLDSSAFARALTADVGLVDVTRETEPTTNYYDVLQAAEMLDDGGGGADGTDSPTGEVGFSSEPHRKCRSLIDESNRQSLVRRVLTLVEDPIDVNHMFSTGAIDFIAERYRSKLIVVLLWTGYLMTYIAYLEELNIDTTIACAKQDNILFGCRIANAIVNWIVRLSLLIALGLAFVGLGSIGNDIEVVHKWTIIIAMAVIAFFSWFLFVRNFDEAENSPPHKALSFFLSLIIGNTLLFLQLFVLIGGLLWKCTRRKAVQTFLRPGSILSESAIKSASAHKTNSLVKNAREIHNIPRDDGTDAVGTSFASGLLNFSVQGNRYEVAGGFVWVWTRIFNRELFKKEGIWISARLMAANAAQFIISLFFIFWGVYFTKYLVQEWANGLINDGLYIEALLEFLRVRFNEEAIVNDAADRLESAANNYLEFGGMDSCTTYLEELGKLSGNTDLNSTPFCEVMQFASETRIHKFGSLLSNAKNITRSVVNRVLEDAYNSIYPQQEYMVKVPMIVMAAVALASCLGLMFVYIPSVVSTTLRFRCGEIPFFGHKKNFFELRGQMDEITILFGSMVWGALYSSLLLGGVIGSIVFLFLWQVTSVYMVQLLAGLIGLFSTIIIRLLLVCAFLRFVYAGFYRKKLTQGNIASLTLECVNVGLAIGTVLARAIKLVLVALTYIGRMDTPFLAPGVGEGPLADRYPTIFRKDILAHEAHRHPYLEVIGTMYLMKLRYSSHFGRKSGYCYRLLFTIALMPWLRKYRVMARPYLADDEDDALDAALQPIEGALLPKTSMLRQSVMVASMLRCTNDVCADESAAGTVGTADRPSAIMGEQEESKEKGRNETERALIQPSNDFARLQVELAAKNAELEAKESEIEWLREKLAQSESISSR